MARKAPKADSTVAGTPRAPLRRGSRFAAPWTLLLAIVLLAAAAGCPKGEEKPPSSDAPSPAAAGAEASTEEPPAPPMKVSQAEIEELVARRNSEQWYGVYMMGTKVGHARVWMRATEDGEPGGFVSGTEMQIRMKGPAGEVEMSAEERRFYAGKAPFRRVETSFVQKASGAEDSRRAVAGPDGLVVERTLDGEAQPKRTLPATEETLSSLLATMPLNLAELHVGQRFSATLFNWQLEKDDRVHVEVKSLDREMHAGVESRTATIGVSYEGMHVSAETKMADGGVVLEMALGPGLRLKLEEKAVAQSQIRGLDVLGAGIEVERRLGIPRTIVGLVLDVGVPEGFALPRAANQQVTPVEGKPNRFRVELKAAPGAPVTEEERKPALASDATFDHHASAIRELVAELTEGTDVAAEKVRRMATWVYRNIDKELATHLPSASLVLAKKVGDCTEHTWLFVALARAAGIPARPAYGVAYVGDAHHSFGYHAWAEVDLNGHWVAVDPTWGEERADATHLKLSGELPDVAVGLGGISIEVVGDPVR